MGAQPPAAPTEHAQSRVRLPAPAWGARHHPAEGEEAGVSLPDTMEKYQVPGCPLAGGGGSTGPTVGANPRPEPPATTPVPY